MKKNNLTFYITLKQYMSADSIDYYINKACISAFIVFVELFDKSFLQGLFSICSSTAPLQRILGTSSIYLLSANSSNKNSSSKKDGSDHIPFKSKGTRTDSEVVTWEEFRKLMAFLLLCVVIIIILFIAVPHMWDSYIRYQNHQLFEKIHAIYEAEQALKNIKK